MKDSVQEQKNRIEFEKRERYAMSRLASVIRERHPHNTYDWHYSQISSGLPYDAILYAFKDTTLKGKYIVEAKNRTEHWQEGFYLEAKKLKEMQKVNRENGNEFSLLYINFTPLGTLIWILDDIVKGKPSNEVMNKKTYKGDAKKKKSVYRLNPEDALDIDYIFDETEYLASLIVPEKPKPVVKTYSLF